jgi:hypothetical protein
MASCDSWASSYRIDPPVRRNAWGAKANVKRTGTGRSDDFLTLSEHSGKPRQRLEERPLQRRKVGLRGKVTIRAEVMARSFCAAAFRPLKWPRHKPPTGSLRVRPVRPLSSSVRMA